MDPNKEGRACYYSPFKIYYPANLNVIPGNAISTHFQNRSISPSVLDYLISKGADINGSFGAIPLHNVCENNPKEIIV